jgi:hypothetical protein
MMEPHGAGANDYFFNPFRLHKAAPPRCDFTFCSRLFCTQAHPMRWHYEYKKGHKLDPD